MALLLSNSVSIVTKAVNKEQPRRGPVSTPRERTGPACLFKAQSSGSWKGLPGGRLEAGTVERGSVEARGRDRQAVVLDAYLSISAFEEAKGEGDN